ncbi:hypothetical protein COBT_003665, partial [Conglomerata obtusa]
NFKGSINLGYRRGMQNNKNDTPKNCKKKKQKLSQNVKIITDCWSGYWDLNWVGFNQYSVNHSENFVDQNFPWIHTQNIER